MELNTSYWKRLVANSVATVVNNDTVGRILDKRVCNTRDLERRSTASFSYSDEKELHLATPEYIGGLPKEIQELCGNHHIPEWKVYELSNSNLVGPNALTITDGGTYVLANSLDSQSLLTRELAKCIHSGTIPRYRGEITEQIDLGVSLVGPWSTGFFHWFAEYLPQLEGVKHFESVTGEKPVLIIPNSPPNWLMDSLSLLGFDSNQIIEWSGGRVSIDRLVVPEVRHAPVQNGYIHDPFGLEWVGERLRKSTPTIDQDWPSHVFISRDDADERRVKNERQVMQILENYGFSRVVLSDYSLAEQIAMFRQADVVVGPHGAGLLNVIYSDNVRIVEIFGEYRNGCYYTMSGLNGVTYVCLVGDPVAEDIRVPPRLISKIASFEK